jgi:hypothetical protein
MLQEGGFQPPVCCIHNVPLLLKQLPAEMVGGGYKSFTYFLCPVSGSVLNDEETREKADPRCT